MPITQLRALVASTLLVLLATLACTFPDFKVVEQRSGEGSGSASAGSTASGGASAVAGQVAARGGEGGTIAQGGLGGSRGGDASAGGDGGNGAGQVAELLLGYAFDDLDTGVADFSGHGRTASIGPVAWVPGHSGQAIKLDGKYGFVTLPVTGITEGHTDFTACLWVRPDTVPTSQRLFSFGAGPDTFVELVAATETGRPRFVISEAGSVETADSKFALTVGAWQHVCVVQSASAVTLYFGGAPIGSTSSISQHASDFSASFNYLGRSQSALEPYFAGTLDDFRWFDRALSTGEITALAAGTIQTKAGLLIGYAFDEVGGAIAVDFSGNARDAKVTRGVSTGSGTAGAAAELDGSTGYLSLPDDVVDGVNDFTIACFVQQASLRASARLFDFASDAGDYMALIPVGPSSQRLRFAIRNGGTDDYLDSVTLPLSEWQHIAVTKAGSSISVFVNGKLVASGVFDDFPNLDTLTRSRIGRSNGSEALFAGAIDDFRIYDRALAASELALVARGI